MSTTFEIYPGTAFIPSFHDVLLHGTRALHTFLRDMGIDAIPMITVALRNNASHHVQPIDLSAPMMWDDDVYAWFTVQNVSGGTDATFKHLDEFRTAAWHDWLDLTPHDHPFHTLVQSSLAHGYMWSFRRSAGQSAIVALTYGLLAAVLADLTDGFVYSDDGAWDYARFPARAPAFLQWYFRPQHALHQETREWAEACLDEIAAELAGEQGVAPDA